MLLELHSHSWYSKGSILGEENTVSPIEMVKEARRRGLSGIAITDHNNFKNWESLKKLKFDDFVVIPGEEVSTLQGHLLTLGITEEIKPKQDVLETIDKVHQQGGITIAPHPFDIAKEGIRDFSKFTDVIEVFNSMSLDKFANLRAKRFAVKFGKPMSVGTDAHQKEWIGRSITQVNSYPDIDSVLEEIMSGNTQLKKQHLSVKEMTDWYLTRLNRNYDSALKHIDINYGLFKRGLTKNLMKFSGKETFFSRGLVSSLSYFSLTFSIIYSFFVNFPRCLA